MSEISSQRSFRLLLFFSSYSLLVISGLCDDSSTPKTGTKSDAHSTSGGNKGSSIVIICVAVVAVVLLSFLLFKFWQKKKRAEQYARLLKLFEEDDELEVELGLRD